MTRLIGYVGTKDLDSVREEDARSLNVINIAFALVEQGDVVWEHPECRDALARLRSLNPELKIVISVGGWGAGGFSEAAFTEAGRQRFADTALGIVREYGLDGVDIDWEYPCFSVAEIGGCPEDKENYTLLLSCLRDTLEREAAGRYLVTAAVGGDDYFIRNTQMDRVGELLDYVQLMTYDLRGGFQVLTGHHTNLYTYQTDLSDQSADKAVRRFHEAGVPLEKLVLGAAFYCREWKGVMNPANHGLCQMASTTGSITHHYGELLESYINKNGYVRYWDDEAKAPYLFDGENFISYDDPESLAWKIRYLKEKGLGGIMYWEYCCDGSHTLTEYMRKELDR